jgi:D-alanyl-D-alanine carboxypeptidase
VVFTLLGNDRDMSDALSGMQSRFVMEDIMDRIVSRRATLAFAPGLLLAASLMRFDSALARSVATPIAATPGATDRLTALLNASVDSGIPGVVLRAQAKGKQPIYAAAGLANMEESTPISIRDRFRIYSVTKTFTATVVLQLVDENVLSLDDTVTKWLSDPEVLDIPNTDTITLRQLLNHTSGIYDYFDDDSPFINDAFLGENADWSKIWTPLELLTYAGAENHAPYNEPGIASHYANTNYVLIGLIVEEATGNRFADELQKRILTPLKLTETSLPQDVPIITGTVDGYHSLEGELVNLTASNASWAWTAGGMVSTLDDLATFSAAAFSGSLLSPESFAEMVTFVPEKPGAQWGWGFGIYRRDSPAGTMMAMDGESAGFSSAMVWLPDLDVSLVMLGNLGGSPLFDQLRDQIIADIAEHGLS